MTVRGLIDNHHDCNLTVYPFTAWLHYIRRLVLKLIFFNELNKKHFFSIYQSYVCVYYNDKRFIMTRRTKFKCIFRRKMFLNRQ